MTLEVDNGKHAGFRLESKHSLVRSLVLPSAGTNQRGSFVIDACVTMDVASYENVGNFPNDEPIFRFWR